ncbi:hypothetical protein [Rubellimicrobium arenae]|uniref:hypothetical protein n=1 Tax=Rubellimicrobium arenae TaxID=2817372 RepID=UPI001B3076FA|nr:hypothetical protein [Rubellimicrobium arenae]
MWRLIKVLLILAVLAGIALIAFAYVGPLILPGDFQPPSHQVEEPVELNLQ